MFRIWRQYKIGFLGLALLVPLIGAGTVRAVSFLSKDETRLKQLNIPKVPVGERAVDQIGIFPPGFDKDVAALRSNYEKEYGAEGYRLIQYKGYTLLVPNLKAGKEFNSAKAEVDELLASAALKTPTQNLQKNQIEEIVRVFGADPQNVTFDPYMGAYTDEKGFQYNFQDGRLISKHVGVNNELTEKFLSSYPHLVPGGIRQEFMNGYSNEKLAEKAALVAFKLLGDAKMKEMGQPQMEVMEGGRVGLVYQEGMLRIMLDKVTGDVIYFYNASQE